jgi:hypothetical protein
MKEGVRSSETLVTIDKAIWCSMSEDCCLHTHKENLNSHCHAIEIQSLNIMLSDWIKADLPYPDLLA